MAEARMEDSASSVARRAASGVLGGNEFSSSLQSSMWRALPEEKKEAAESAKMSGAASNAASRTSAQASNAMSLAGVKDFVEQASQLRAVVPALSSMLMRLEPLLPRPAKSAPAAMAMVDGDFKPSPHASFASAGRDAPLLLLAWLPSRAAAFSARFLPSEVKVGADGDFCSGGKDPPRPCLTCSFGAPEGAAGAVSKTGNFRGRFFRGGGPGASSSVTFCRRTTLSLCRW
mmetsp:Transcript_52567/g.94368  ORF Transcript_52567/g.94368 Transcript_52567/m.94368 type:complete len:231 (+) Transcript_52567:119-811(+)